MPQEFSFPAAWAAAEAETGMDLNILGTAGAWGEVASDCPYLVPLEAFGGAEPPPLIRLDCWFILAMGGYAAHMAYPEVPGFFAGIWGGFAVYVPDGPLVLQWGSREAPDPEFSAGLEDCYLGAGWFLGNAYVHVSSPDFPGQPFFENAVSWWKIEGLIRYVPTAPPNQPPTARVSADKTVVAVGQSVQFQGDQSTDPEGAGLSYFWVFGDGATSTDPNPTHTYVEPNTYTVRLTVHDPQSGEDTAEFSILVMRIDRLTVDPAKAALSSGGTRQFTAWGTWFGPDGQPDTADDVKADVTSLVSWRVEPREAGEPVPGAVTATGLFTAGAPAGRLLRGYVCSYLENGPEARAEVDVWVPMIRLDWVEPARGSLPEIWVEVSEKYRFTGKVTYVNQTGEGETKEERPWNFQTDGKLSYTWTVKYEGQQDRAPIEQANQAAPPTIELNFPKPGKYTVQLEAKTTQGKLVGVEVHPSATVHAVRVIPHYGVVAATVAVTLEGAKFGKKEEVSFGDGIQVASVSKDGSQATIQIAAEATPGPRDVRIDKDKLVERGFYIVKVQVEAIKFDFDKEKNADGTMKNKADGQDIREDNDTDIVPPEYKRQGNPDKPGAYIQGQNAKLKIKFSVEPAELVATFTLRALKGGVLGPVTEKPVVLKPAGGGGDLDEEGYAEISCQNAISSGIKSDDNVAWEWQIGNINGSGGEFGGVGSTKHKIYVLLDRPAAPMADAWTKVLDYSCKWAEDEKTFAGAATKVTQRFYGCGRFKYDTIWGENNYTEDAPVKGESFNLTKLIERLNNGVGKGEAVGCNDCANAVVIFSNALGDSLKNHYLGNTTWVKFKTNKYIAIGFQDWTAPTFGWVFAYHAVAWRGNADAMDGVVYDATLKVDNDNDPTRNPPSAPWVPVNIVFSKAGAYNDYRDKLVQPDSYENCKPISTAFHKPLSPPGSKHGWCWCIPVK